MRNEFITKTAEARNVVITQLPMCATVHIIITNN